MQILTSVINLVSKGLIGKVLVYAMREGPLAGDIPAIHRIESARHK